jgi:predicted TIM-barrel fold metal-dependent hydrolase
MNYDLMYHNPAGDFVAGSVPPGAAAGGCDVALLRQQHLDPDDVEHALLCHGTGMLVPALAVPRLTVEFTRAINDWTIERWLTVDPRVSGTVLVPTQVPELAAEEIRRVGRHERMAAVLLGANGLGKPFGHPVYHPILKAAHELGLPIVIRAGGDELVESATYPAAAGLPGTYSEYRVLAPQTMMTHTGSLICQGVMNRYRSLRFLLLGASIAWITPFLWRLDTEYKAFRSDVLWLRTLPSEVFRERFFVGTHPCVFSGAEDRLVRYLAVDHGLEDLVCYASGYPDGECTTPSAVQRVLPPSWRAKVLRENALRFLGRATASEPSTSADGRTTRTLP